MPCIIEGAEKLRWSVPEWVARNAFFFLVPELEKFDDAQPLAQRLAKALEERTAFINLSDFFTKPTSARIWHEAINRADAVIGAENPADWNEPSAYEPFRTAFRKLRMIAPGTNAVKEPA